MKVYEILNEIQTMSNNFADEFAEYISNISDEELAQLDKLLDRAKPSMKKGPGARHKQKPHPKQMELPLQQADRGGAGASEGVPS